MHWKKNKTKCTWHVGPNNGPMQWTCFLGPLFCCGLDRGEVEKKIALKCKEGGRRRRRRRKKPRALNRRENLGEKLTERKSFSQTQKHYF